MHQQRKAVTRAARDRGSIPTRSGLPLDHTTRQWMESRFAYDFSRVRVHADRDAASAADSLGARAFTQNGHIAFAAGEYAPHTTPGRELLAHELAHVAGAREPHADTAARDVMIGRAPAFAYAPAPHAIQRKEKSLQERAKELAQKLQILIETEDDVWRTARKEHSAPARERAEERRTGTLDDLTGIGRIQSIDRFVTALQTLRLEWDALAPQQRANRIGKSASAELEHADVPGFIGDVFLKDKENPVATFSPGDWAFSVWKKKMEESSLDVDSATKLANVGFHEARHAEQNFLAARYAAGQGKNAKAITAEHAIPIKIAKVAVQKKFSGATAPEIAKLGAEMYSIHVEHRDDVKVPTNDAMIAGRDKVIAKREEARELLQQLNATPSETTIANANKIYEELVDEIHGHRAAFQSYLDLPSERDASEVGEAASVAFRSDAGLQLWRPLPQRSL